MGKAIKSENLPRCGDLTRTVAGIITYKNITNLFHNKILTVIFYHAWQILTFCGIRVIAMAIFRLNSTVLSVNVEF